jgi:hypothetical protein
VESYGEEDSSAKSVSRVLTENKEEFGPDDLVVK